MRWRVQRGWIVMGLHSIGFSYLRESHAPARPSQGRCHSACAPAVSLRSGADAGLDSHPAQVSASKVSFAPTSGHTCQMLREFDSLCDLRGLARVTRARRNHRQLRAPSLSGRSAPISGRGADGMFCVSCYDYHRTHACVRKPVQPARHLPIDRTG